MRNLAKRIQEGLKGLYTPPAVIFEELGFRYIGPLNGHKLKELVDTFSRVREMKGPRFVHVVTCKGRGFPPAEKNPERFHGIGPFNCQTGEEKSKTKSYTDVFGDALVKIARTNKKIVAISAGMCLGTGLARFREEIPERFFDVGITEQHAVTMAAALAIEGYIPVCAIYSTFLQRAYDQLIHDVALQKLPVVFCVDRAGLVGEDGPTHHGPFDISYASAVPNLIVSAPKDGTELVALLKTAVAYRNGPFIIRYPRGACGTIDREDPPALRVGEWETVRDGKNPVIIAVGSMVRETLAAVDLLKSRRLDPLVINGRFVKPLDEAKLDKIAERTPLLFTVEENSVAGGFGSGVSDYFIRRGRKVKVYRIGLPDQFVEHGSRERLLKITGLDGDGIARQILDNL
jgi:1-deoxy-D-xylulose-5-phosphate synthase